MRRDFQLSEDDEAGLHFLFFGARGATMVVRHFDLLISGQGPRVELNDIVLSYLTRTVK